jgi:hypothetical protein
LYCNAKEENTECCTNKRKAFRQNAADVDHKICRNVVLAQAGCPNTTEQASRQKTIVTRWRWNSKGENWLLTREYSQGHQAEGQRAD